MAYRQSWALLPTEAVCAVCGVKSDSGSMEKHHVAGRRKTSYCFYVLLHTECHHQKVHANPKWAEANGLLWSGRNSKMFCLTDANALVKLWPHPQTYPIDIYEQFSLTKI